MTPTQPTATTGSTQRSSDPSEDSRQKKDYRMPSIRPVGKVQQIVLSPSPGTFESGSGAGFKP